MNSLNNVANVMRQLLSILAFCWVASLTSSQQGTPAAEASTQNAIETLQVSQQGGGSSDGTLDLEMTGIKTGQRSQ